jgi:membrane associated rhomboid family serine protease
MAKQESNPSGLSMPILGMIVVGIAGALIVSCSFVIIQYWPLPASVAPALDFGQGLAWGAVVGAISGFVLGFLVDEKHFTEQ